MTYRQSFQMISEMKEFATFTAAEQRYIRRSLDVASVGVSAADHWSRHDGERADIEAQARLYRGTLTAMRETVPDDIELRVASNFVTQLIMISASDLGEGKLASFAAYRFLYERLIGGSVRPWLASAFMAAAALPHVHPNLRRTLLRSIGEDDVLAAGWSSREAVFTPEWVDKVPVTVF
jgi:hypothetical protein